MPGDLDAQARACCTDEEDTPLLLDVADRLEEALIASRDVEAAPTMLIQVKNLRATMHQALTNAELTKLLQHTFEMHAAKQASGSLPGSPEERNCWLLVIIGVTLWMQCGIDDEDSRWCERRAEALGLGEGDTGVRPPRMRP